jgi:hypothetical protein
MEQSDPQRHMQNGHPVRTIVVMPGSELEALLKKMEREKVTHGYTTLDAVAREGCHAAVARPMRGQNAKLSHEEGGKEQI